MFKDQLSLYRVCDKDQLSKLVELKRNLCIYFSEKDNVQMSYSLGPISALRLEVELLTPEITFDEGEELQLYGISIYEYGNEYLDTIYALGPTRLSLILTSFAEKIKMYKIRRGLMRKNETETFYRGEILKGD